MRARVRSGARTASTVDRIDTRIALSKATREADEKGVAAKTLIRQGHAGNEILKAVDETGSDLIVVGSHGRSDVDRILLGSVSSFVVANSRVAVLVVRP